MNSSRIFQWFYYFRTAYSIYLSHIVSLPAYLLIIYSYINNSFPNFRTFVVIFGATIIISGVILGWWHIRHSQGYRSELDATVPMNPFNYKAVPGKELELNLPYFVLSVDLMIRLYDTLTPGLLKPEDRAMLEAFKNKAKLLVEGGSLNA